MTGPRPLILVHQLVGAFSTSCGRRFAGQRRFDGQLGTFVQDSCHTTLDKHSAAAPWGAVCADCLANPQASAEAEPTGRQDARHALPS